MTRTELRSKASNWLDELTDGAGLISVMLVILALSDTGVPERWPTTAMTITCVMIVVAAILRPSIDEPDANEDDEAAL